MDEGLPNWGSQASDLGVPIVEGFNYDWIRGEKLVKKWTISSGTYGIVLMGKYEEMDVVMKYSIVSITCQELLTVSLHGTLIHSNITQHMCNEVLAVSLHSTPIHINITQHHM